LDESEIFELAQFLGIEKFFDVKPATLSKGERSLIDLCVLLISKTDLGGIVIVDEFTSFLDRECAAHVCHGLSQWLRKWNHAVTKSTISYREESRHPIQLIFVGCHDDVVQFLRPHWVYETSMHTVVRFDLNKGKEETKRDRTSCPSSSLSPFSFLSSSSSSSMSSITSSLSLSVPISIPAIELRIVPCVPSLWKEFRCHHYKTKKLSKVATTYVALATCTLFTNSQNNKSQVVCCREEPVAMVSTIRHNGPASDNGIEPSRAHRTVVLPTWQGIGIGSHVSDGAGEIRTRGLESKYYGQTVHPAFGSYRDRSPLWVPTQYNHTIQEFKIATWKQRKKFIRVRLDVPKYVYSHRYVGDLALGVVDGEVDEEVEESESVCGATVVDSNDQGGRRATELKPAEKTGRLGRHNSFIHVRDRVALEERAAWKRARMTVISQDAC